MTAPCGHCVSLVRQEQELGSHCPPERLVVSWPTQPSIPPSLRPSSPPSHHRRPSVSTPHSTKTGISDINAVGARLLIGRIGDGPRSDYLGSLPASWTTNESQVWLSYDEDYGQDHRINSPRESCQCKTPRRASTKLSSSNDGSQYSSGLGHAQARSCWLSVQMIEKCGTIGDPLTACNSYFCLHNMPPRHSYDRGR